ncbi:GAS1 [Bugula neritina]|uniref:GAS1 n=1 Tax=Bugula neritina TaxID=10212 RepID=A0A7J7KR83_BUGNE|nr:GAS1 [Bugula neritina]
MLTFLLALTLLVTGVFGEAPNCMDARNKCISRIGCSMALNNFQIACEKVQLGLVDQCTDQCMRAVVSLVTVDSNIGTDYLTCNCEGNKDCDLWKRRVETCSADVFRALESLDNEEVISCSLARMLCDADTQCWTALSYYEKFCSNLWILHTTEHEKTLDCSPKCNNSLAILYKQTRAAKLKNCVCDDADPYVDEKTCIRMRYNTQKSCFGEDPKILVVNHNLLLDIVKSERQTLKNDSNAAADGAHNSRALHVYLVASWAFLFIYQTIT